MLHGARRSLLLFALVLCVHGCGGGGDDGDDDAQSGASNVGGWASGTQGWNSTLLRWNEYDTAFPWPAKQPWNSSSSASTASHIPHHNGYDLFLKTGNAAPIRGKFHYGDLRIDLPGEKVGLWLRKTGDDAWIFVGDAVTDGDGRVEFPFPSAIQGPGTWFVKMVVYGDLTTADALVRIVSGIVPCAVFDVDGTLTISDFELVQQVLTDFLDFNYVPRMYDHANKVVAGLAKSGVEIVYLTARPYWLSRATRRWLRLKGFPVGCVYTYEGALPTMGSATSDAKRDRLLAMQAEGAQFVHAFGNATTDISAYAEAGIPPTSTYIVGENAGQGGTIALAKYGDLLGALVPAPYVPYRAVLIVVDGLRPDALQAYLATVAGPDSALKLTFGTAVQVKNTLSTAPSITFAANASIATGRNPSGHGMPGNQYLDRREGKPMELDGGPTLEVSQVLSIYRNEGLANQQLRCETLFEQMSASGMYAAVDAYMFYRGSEFLQPSYLQLLSYLTDARAYDRKVTDRFLDRLDGKDTPDLLMIYWPGLDHEAHSEGGIGGVELSPPGLANLQIEYLKNVIDPELARVRQRMQELGILQNAVFVLSSDHGHRDVTNDDAHAVETDILGLDEELEKVIEDSPYDDLYDKPGFLEGDFDSFTGLNGGVLHVSLRNRVTQNWKDAPDFQNDVLPVIGSIQQHRMRGELVNAVEEILVRTAPGQPYRVVRPTQVKIVFESVKVLDDEDTFGPGELTFELRANGKLFETVGPFTANDGDTIALDKSHVVDVMPGMALKVECEGEDDDWWFFTNSLGTAQVPYASKGALPSQTVVVASSNGDFELKFHVEIVPLETYVYPELPGWGNSCPLAVLSAEYANAPERIEKLEHAETSGDILVFSRFRDGYYWGGKNAANHGSLYPEDSIQTFVIGGAPVTQPLVIEGGSIVDIAATVAHILGIDLRGKEGSSKASPFFLPLLPN
ncbi:MAG: alkaline phosphatase family protein [Planctomycetes bacterium]|nr:alkaline phosphatase family protein [Planctomycetota bacterium]